MSEQAPPVSAQNRNGTAPGRPFAPGNRANPGGRPKSFGALIRQQTDDGAELVAIALEIVRARRKPVKYRLQALEFLADRGWGKPVQEVDARVSHTSGLLVFDYAAAVAGLVPPPPAAGPDRHRLPPGPPEGAGDGPPLGEDPDGW